MFNELLPWLPKPIYYRDGKKLNAVYSFNKKYHQRLLLQAFIDFINELEASCD